MQSAYFSMTAPEDLTIAELAEMLDRTTEIIDKTQEFVDRGIDRSVAKMTLRSWYRDESLRETARKLCRTFDSTNPMDAIDIIVGTIYDAREMKEAA